MTFGQFIAVLRARWRVMLLIFALTTLSVLGVTLLLPAQYTGEASVVVDFKPDPLSAAMLGGAANPAFMATQVDIVNSPRVAQRVVRDLKLAEVPELRRQWQEVTEGQGNFELWLQKAIQKKMDVVPSRVSSVITITYKAPDPKFAAAVANAFMKAYIDTTLELRVDPARRYSNFFDTRVKEARDALEKSQNMLSAFQKEKGIIATDERLDIENARLNELSSQMIALQALASESSSRNAAAQGSQSDRIQEVLNNPLISQLKSDINRGEARLQELNIRLGDNNPQVLEAKASLSELRTRLDAETRRVTSGVGVSNTIVRQREGQVRVDMEAQRVKVLRMKAVRDEGLLLVRDVENSQRSFDTMSQRLTQTSLESQATQSNVNILSQAVPPNDQSSPRVVLNMLLAVFFGAILAIATAVLRELRDRRIRSDLDITSSLGLPVLGVMCKPESKLQLGGRKASPMQTRLMAPVSQSSKGA